MRIFFIVLGTVFLTSCDRDAIVEEVPNPVEEHVVVTYVVDGDTIEVEFVDGTTERVRVIGIDSTEEGECYFEEAKAALTDMIEGQYVAMTHGEQSDNRDEYDRLLRYVRSTSGDVGLLMITQGYAKHYPWFAHEKESEYTEAEAFAKIAELGMWVECTEDIDQS